MKVIAAFACIYLIWGSTYLAIRFAVETLPPFMMGGMRFLCAGAILLVWAAAADAPRPKLPEWRAAALAGLFFFLGGNGALVWAQQRVASGIAALIIATMPLWMVLIDWMRPGGVRPPGRVFAGLSVGLVGIAMLVEPGAAVGGGRVDPVGAAVLVLGSVSWAAGSIYWSQAPRAASARFSNGIQMAAGGAALLILGIATGDLRGFDPGDTTVRAWLSWGYLLVFGSLIGFTAYTFLLRVSTPARVSTYAFVNPVVAVALGWAAAGERVTARTMVAAAVILLSVAATSAAAPARVESRA
jgi:drug/metabolite transporter (DMT)-like permease